MHSFFFSDLIQLYSLQHALNNEAFIIRKTVRAALWYFIMQLYRQSSHCQDVFYSINSIVLHHSPFTVLIYSPLCIRRAAQWLPQTQPYCWRYDCWTCVLASTGGS